MTNPIRYRVDVDQNQDPVAFQDLTDGTTFLFMGKATPDRMVWRKIHAGIAQPVNDSNIGSRQFVPDRTPVQLCSLVLE